jgi:hypothetical protein
MTPPPSPLQPGSGAQPAKKSNVLLWILIGVGGFFALIVVAVLAGGLFLVHKARQAGLDSVSIQDGKKGHLQVKTADGTIQIGGDAKIPTWVPDYPGSNPQNAFSAQGKDGRSGTFTFKTQDSADHVVKFYREQLEAAGLKVAVVVNSGSGQVITSEDEVKRHTFMVVAGAEGNQTTVNVTYTNK